MINLPITKMLFLDIETVGVEKDYDTCLEKRPRIAEQFKKYLDWFEKRFPEDKGKTINEIFSCRAALVPEFAKIVTISVAFVTDNDEIKTQTFSGEDESIVLKDSQKLLDRVGKLDFWLCGHNLKNFDIPMLAKRMVINGFLPPSILPSYDTKPWEIKAIDTKEIWQFGSYSSIGSLDLVCSTMDIPTPKGGEVTGDKVHDAYWNKGMLEEISKYCEKDVKVLIDFIRKLKNLR